MWKEGDLAMGVGTGGGGRKKPPQRGRRGSRGTSGGGGGGGSVAFGSSGGGPKVSGTFGSTAVSKETQALLDKMMKDRGLNRRQMQQIAGGLTHGGGLPSNPSEVQRDGNMPDYRPPPGASIGSAEWAGLGSRHGASRYTDARGRHKDLGEFTDWRTVQLPPQRKTKTAILGELNCGPSGRPQPEQYRPAPQLGPTREQQKEKLIMKMAYDGLAPDGSSTVAPAPRPPQPAPLPPQPEPDSMDEFLAVMQEIEERQAWIIKMKKLGALKQDDETRVKAEIAERVAKMKTMDKKLQGS